MNDLATLQPPQQKRQNFAVETASAAAATRSAALIAAYFTRAINKPRDWDEVRAKLIRRCRTPEFARSPRTWYRKPIGKGVEGLGIGFVEEALQCMTNSMRESTMIFEDDLMEVWKCSIIDLESNSPIDMEFKVSKTVERSKAMDDGTYISMRRNSYGNLVYTVPASDDDLLNKRAAMRSKAWRALGLSIIPGDLKDECTRVIRETRLDEAAKDPDAERKRIADAFGEIGVKPSQISAYLGHDLGTCSPAELIDLRGLFGAIREGEATWAGAMANRMGGDDDDGSGDEGAAKKEAGPTAAEKVRERLRAKKQGKEADPPAATPAGAAAGPGEASAPASAPAAGAAEPDLLGEQQERPAGHAPTGQSAALLRGQLMSAATEDEANLIIDRARHLPKADYDGLVTLLESRFPRE